ncbi:MAG: hypothetical protein OCD02_21190 [Spirochaetaceae bacterium]
MNNVEIIGYIASILVAISLTMSQILKLRVINTVGCVAFSIYGYFVGAFPVMIVNAFIACINVYYLIKMYKNKDSFNILDGKDNLSYLENFYLHYKNDIKTFFTEFTDDQLNNNKVFFILRNMRPVNLVVFNEQDNGIIDIMLDYTIPEYRDSLNGKYLLSFFEKVYNADLKKQLVVKSNNKEHMKYLKRLKFKQNDAGLFVLKL